MCMNSEEISPCSPNLTFALLHRRPSKRHNIRIRRLNRRRSSSSREAKRKEKLGLIKTKTEMELKNLRLYRENQSIIKENEKLRMKALLLHQENQALLSQLQTKFPYYPLTHHHPK